MRWMIPGLSLAMGGEGWWLAATLYQIPGWEAGLGTAAGTWLVLTFVDRCWRSP